MTSHTPSPPEQLVQHLLPNPIRPDSSHTLAGIKHRQQLVDIWQIRPGDKVLEIGGGQGDFTVVLADAVGPEGQVVVVDPAPLDYGSPNQRDAHDHIHKSPVGSRITFIQDDPVHYLTESSESFTHVVLCHCIWYFAEPSILPPIAALALSVSSSLLIAEHALVTSHMAAVPHILAAIAWSVLENCRSVSSSVNIRNASTPKQIRAMVENVGWKINNECFVVPDKAQRDGYQEAQMVRMKMFGNDLEAVAKDDATKSMLLSLREVVEMSVGRLEGGVQNVRNMDVWVASFTKA